MKPTLHIMHILTALITLLLCSNVNGLNIKSAPWGDKKLNKDVVDFSLNGRNFKYVKNPFLNFSQARIHCRDHFKGDLADLRNSEEVKEFAEFGYEWINGYPDSTKRLAGDDRWNPFVGGQTINKKTWTWANNANSTNLENGKLFADGIKPNPELNQFCTILFLGYTRGHLNAEYCSKLSPFICLVP